MEFSSKFISQALRHRYPVSMLVIDLTITTSIGVTSMEVGVDEEFEAMFHAGDEGVYKAKENGRNQVVYVGLN